MRLSIPTNTFQFEPLEHRRLLSLGAPDSYPVNDNATPLSADLDGDERADLVTSSRDGNSVNVLLAKADGSFHSVQSHPTAPAPVSLEAGDFNNDGHVDLVTAHLYQWPDGGSISLLLGNGDGSFQSRRSFPLPNVDPLALTRATSTGTEYWT